MKAGFHHDLRLERDGVLKSWAVPKCMPEWPKVKRRVVPVEDHDLRYGNFEGIIPEGQYGAGVVRVWDRGKYETKTWSDTKIEFILTGKKLRGEYIIRWMDKMGGWLLWKR